MRQQTGRMLTMHDEALEDHPVVHRRPLAIAGSLVTLPTRRLVEDQPGEYAHEGLLRRESLHRRLLGAFDVLAAMASLLFVLRATGAGDPVLLALAFAPLVVVLFKIAGLYDRDLMRLVHSTLDEAPALLQLTGLYVPGVAIVAPIPPATTLGASRSAALGPARVLRPPGRRPVAPWPP